MIEPLTRAQLDAYFERVGFSGPATRTGETLAALQRAHMMSIPFENLDIVYFERRIELSFSRFFDKLVRDRRGGFCFEQNGLFASVLAALGFDVAMISAAVHIADGEFSPPYDHMTLSADGYLTDVGFGDAMLVPVPLRDGAEVDDGRARYRVTDEGDHWMLWLLKDEPERSYKFWTEPCALERYVARCDWLQTDEESNFRKRPFCSVATPDGRVTVAGERFIRTVNGERTETPITRDDLPRLLKEHFGIDA